MTYKFFTYNKSKVYLIKKKNKFKNFFINVI